MLSSSLLAGSGIDIGQSIAVMPDGSFYVVGYYSSPTLSAGALVVTNGDTNGGTNDAFVARFDTQGDPVWLRSFGGPGVDSATSVVVDASNHVYVAGEFMDTATFSASPLVTRSAAGARDGFVARLDANGALQWVEVAAGPFSTDVAVEVVALDDRLPATGVEVSMLLAVAVLASGLVLVARGRRIARW